jgi:CMP-N,N'-diacetyllegionaminic acid synthase
MPHLGKTIIHIPARAGSKRVPMKNLRMIRDKPMIGYGIDVAMHFSDQADIYVNTDSPEIMDYARSCGTEVYARDASLASDTASGDDFTIDIIERLKPDTLIMISPVCPLVTVEDVAEAINQYKQSDHADTLISVTETSMQTVFRNQFVNIEPIGPLAPSQDNEKVTICNWAITIWNAQEFRKNYRAYNGGYCGTRRILFPINPLHATKVSDEMDFQLAEQLIVSREIINSKDASYWKSS